MNEQFNAIKQQLAVSSNKETEERLARLEARCDKQPRDNQDSPPFVLTPSEPERSGNASFRDNASNADRNRGRRDPRVQALKQ